MLRSESLDPQQFEGREEAIVSAAAFQHKMAKEEKGGKVLNPRLLFHNGPLWAAPRCLIYFGCWRWMRGGGRGEIGPVDPVDQPSVGHTHSDGSFPPLSVYFCFVGRISSVTDLIVGLVIKGLRAPSLGRFSAKHFKLHERGPLRPHEKGPQTRLVSSIFRNRKKTGKWSGP